MPSPFAKYQSEQVQQIAPGFVEAFGNAGRSIGQGLAAAGQAAVQGYEEAEKKQKEELALKGALAPYIKNDDRVKRAEDFAKAGIFTRAADGTLTVSAEWADKVNMPEVDKVLSFYNTTGGDGSKLKGEALTEFTARYQGEQKYVSDQAARAAAQVELDLKKAQIDELKSKANERNANAGNYGAVISTLLGGAPAETSGLTIPSVTLPDTSTPYFQSLTAQPVSKADTTQPGVAAPAAATAPALSPALTTGTGGASAAAPATAKPATDEIDALATEAGMTRDELLEASRISGVTPQEHINNLRAVAKASSAPASPAAAAAAPAAAAPASPAAPAAPATGTAAAAPATQTPAAAPATPQTYDVPAEAARVAVKMKAIEQRRTEVRTKYATARTKLEGQITASNRNLSAAAPRNAKGLELAKATLAFNEGRRKSIDDAEARDLKAVDSEADSIKNDFTNYQAAADAARKGRAEVREIKKDEAAASKEERETVQRIVKGYPMISVFTYQGYGMKDPVTGKLVDPALTAGIQEMPGERYTEASEQIKGYNSAQDFLLNMKATLRERENATGNRAKELGQRFLLTASNMENYFKAELASVFGVAAFRKPIVSGGNFSDADREFVRQAITYLNTANPSMSNKDLESSLKALSFMINGLYQSQIEGLGMTYNPEAAKARATALTSGGDKVGAGTIQKQVERTDRFYKSFNLNQGPASSISRAEIDAARAQLQRALRFEFSPEKARKDNEAALKASTK